MPTGLKILIPMGGEGSRLRPLTWSKLKSLVSLAGKTVLDYVLEMCESVPAYDDAHFIFSINAQNETEIKDFMAQNHPELHVSFCIDTEMRGQADAFWTARDLLSGPLLVVFSDTIIENNFSFLEGETADGVAWVKPVPDPRRFGVGVLDEQGWIREIIEKPAGMIHNLATVGVYYFKDSRDILSAVQEQIDRELFRKNEFYIADALNILLAKGFKLRSEQVDVWLDTGNPEALLEANKYLLEHDRDNSKRYAGFEGVVILPPVNINPNAEISASILGPNLSVGDGAVIRESILKDSIIGPGSHIISSRLATSIIGHDVTVVGQTGSLNLGDKSRAVQ